MLTTYIDDTLALRRAFAAFPSGVAVVSALVGDDPAVLVTSSFTVGVSEDPPLVLFAVRKASKTWVQLASAPVLGVSVLGEDAAHHVRQMSAADVAGRLSGVDVRATSSGAVFLDAATAWLECRVDDVHPAGDHDIVVLRVLALRCEPDARSPLVWHRSDFTRLVSA